MPGCCRSTQPTGATRVRRLPLTPAGLIDGELLATCDHSAAADAAHASSSGPFVVARAVTEEPLALLLGRETYGACAGESSTSADSAMGSGASSHVRGPPLRSAAEGGPKELPTLCDALRDAAAQDGGARGITFLAGGEASFESYADLLDNARRMLVALQGREGVRRGDAVALQIADARTHLRVFWACALGGITPVTVAVPNQYTPDNASVAKLLGAVNVLSAKLVFTSAAAVPAVAALTPSDVRVVDAATLLDASVAATAANDAVISGDDVLFYQLTSGSTGTPKCIPERHSAVVSHIRHSAQHCSYRSSDVTLNWLPFDHVVPMLTFHLADVYLQRSALQLPTSEVIADPLVWPRVMAERRVTHSWAPNFGFKLVVQAVAAAGLAQLPLDLACLRSVMNAGEQVTREASQGFAAVCGLDSRVVQPAFGMAECCTCMTYNNAFEPGPSTVRVLKRSLNAPLLQLAADASDAGGGVAEFVSLGSVSPGVEIRICGANGCVLNELQIGRFCIRGPCVMAGYHNNAKANAECMLEDGWLDSGDLGFVHQGELVLTGRAKEMIILRGANYYCYEVEGVVAALPGVRTTRVAATSVRDESEGTEQMLVFFVPAGEAAADAADVRLLHDHGVLLDPLKLLVVAARAQLGAALGAPSPLIHHTSACARVPCRLRARTRARVFVRVRVRALHTCSIGLTALCK